MLPTAVALYTAMHRTPFRKRHFVKSIIFLDRKKYTTSPQTLCFVVEYRLRKHTIFREIIGTYAFNRGRKGTNTLRLGGTTGRSHLLTTRCRRLIAAPAGYCR